jgi:hypothetical protein
MLVSWHGWRRSHRTAAIPPASPQPADAAELVPDGASVMRSTSNVCWKRARNTRWRWRSIPIRIGSISTGAGTSGV